MTGQRPAPADAPQVAEPPAPPPPVGGRKVAAEGVRSACGSEPPRSDGRRPVAWLHISAPGRGMVPTATSRCACGRDRSAVGHRKVLALIADHEAHRDQCPLHTPRDGRTAA